MHARVAVSWAVYGRACLRAPTAASTSLLSPRQMLHAVSSAHSEACASWLSHTLTATAWLIPPTHPPHRLLPADAAHGVCCGH